MSKSKNNRDRLNRRWNDDDFDIEYVDHRGNQKHRREKRLQNFLRSKNVDRLRELEETNDGFDYA